MSNKEMFECLKGMLQIIASRWEDECKEEQEAQYALVYAQLCTAIAALNMPKPFLQIGADILRKDDIIRVEILEETRYRTDGSVMNPKSIQVYTRDVDASENHGSWNTWRNYVYDSPEGQALLGWLQGQSEVLIAYEEPAQGKGEEDEDPPYVSTAPDDGIAQVEPAYPCVCGDSSCSGCF